MNLLQISWTKTSTWKCFHVCCCSQSSVPPSEALNIPLSLPSEILLPGTYTSPKEVTDQNEIQTCLLNVMRVIALPPGKHHTCQVQLSFFAFPMSLLRCTEQCAVCAVSHDYNTSENVSALSGWHSNLPGAELSTRLYTLHCTTPHMSFLSWCGSVGAFCWLCAHGGRWHVVVSNIWNTRKLMNKLCFLVCQNLSFNLYKPLTPDPLSQW